MITWTLSCTCPRRRAPADKTPVKQLDPGKGKTKRAYLWAYRSNNLNGGLPLVVFDYQTSQSSKHARDFLAEWRGHLIVDDDSSYKELFKQGVLEQACWAHSRRNLFHGHTGTGHLPIENNLAGNAIRPIAVDRKGCLLAGSERAGRH